MAKIEFPQQLKALLEDSDFQAPIRLLADRVGEVLADNKLPFFPDYTDHGTDHINRVLKSEVELVPAYVWDKSRAGSSHPMLCDADAAIIIGATLLHDIAMHLRPSGFLELVRKGSRFEALPWFQERQEGHTADRPWHELWEEYHREARRFNDRALGNIIGLESVRQGWKYHSLPEDVGAWETNHCLVIGEFLRRHHARLAHEIAMYGFPGLPVVPSEEGHFPALGDEKGHPLVRLADLIGLTARSHGTSLRVCKAYLDGHYPGTPRPMGSAVLYPMALLRVADYLQIDRQRAPAVLLQLRNPQSPISVQEWKKHLAVDNIGPATDPSGKMVTVSPKIGLELYLQLSELLEGIQKEIDHSTAVLDEAYGTRTDLGLEQLGLAIRRVHSNLASPAFHDSLPFVPERTGFAADPNLLTLLVEPLYGKEPSVGVRELMQNAADAVCELHAWCEAHGIRVESLDLPDQEPDVLIDFVERPDGTWFLRATDKGIGMRLETIQHYFLRAGASFRQSADWAKEFLDEDGHPRVMRAGRFGVGAFSVFLLGPTFRMHTRHAGADKSNGYSIQASADSQLIEISREEALPVGTTIEVEISREAVIQLELNEYEEGDLDTTDWFCWDWPSVVRRIVSPAEMESLPQEYSAPIRKPSHPPEWSVIHPDDFDAVYWTFAKAPPLSCNGLLVADATDGYLEYSEFEWPEICQLGRPNIAVVDHEANLPLTIQRYGLSRNELPFIEDLTRDVTLSFIAHALICGPGSSKDAKSIQLRIGAHPLCKHMSTKVYYGHIGDFSEGFLQWCATKTAFIPADPWLYCHLGSNCYLIHGFFADGDLIDHVRTYRTPKVHDLDFPAMCWDFAVQYDFEEKRHQIVAAMNSLAQSGATALCDRFSGSHIIVSTNHSFNMDLFRKDYSLDWNDLPDVNRSRKRLESVVGSIRHTTHLSTIIAEFEKTVAQDYVYSYSEKPEYTAYAAVIHTGVTAQEPETLMAKIWNECLGPRPIPFDPEARKELIEHGRKHPELKRHIEAWEEMKRTGSEYVK